MECSADKPQIALARDIGRDGADSALRDGCAEGRLERVSRLKAWASHTVRQRRPRARPGDASLWLDCIGGRPSVLGRRRDADLVVADDTVSRRHAHIVRTGGGFMLADLGVHEANLDARQVRGTDRGCHR